jgi:hypothetical protein
MSARTYSPAVQACLEVAAVLVAPNPGICDTVWASEFTTAYEVLFHAVVEETGLSDEEVEAEIQSRVSDLDTLAKARAQEPNGGQR